MCVVSRNIWYKFTIERGEWRELKTAEKPKKSDSIRKIVGQIRKTLGFFSEISSPKVIDGKKLHRI